MHQIAVYGCSHFHFQQIVKDVSFDLGVVRQFHPIKGMDVTRHFAVQQHIRNADFAFDNTFLTQDQDGIRIIVSRYISFYLAIDMQPTAKIYMALDLGILSDNRLNFGGFEFIGFTAPHRF